MGLFNDNFYKEAALFLAVMLNNTTVQALAAGCFTICYMLGAAPGGWCADKFAKGHVIIAAKGIEVAAMIIGAIGIWTGSWPLIITMIGLMGAQSAVFSPAMNGSIPELYPKEYVQTANTVVRIVSTSAIFIGMALAGYLMDMQMPSWRGMPQGVFLVGVLVLVAALVGFAVAFWAPRIKAQGGDVPFPRTGPLESLRELYKIRKDPLLAVCVCGNVFIWSMAAVLTLLTVNLGISQFGMTSRMTAGVKILFLIGVAVGGALSNLIAKGDRFFKIFVPTIYVMGGLLIIAGFSYYYLLPVAVAKVVVIVLISLVGIAGGVDIIPLESFIQIRPVPGEKGRVIAAANFAVFTVMTFGAGLLYVLNKLLEPTGSIGVLGICTVAFGLWLSGRLKKVVEIRNG